MEASLKSENLLREALTLPPEIRSKLASRLIESLDNDDELSPEWRSEIARRVKAIRNGTSPGVSHETVMDEARRALDAIPAG
jgi:putative addiction module component (TIGR02574 family)